MLEEVDEQWSIVNGMHDDFIAERDAYEQERARLQKKFGREPLKGDVKWGLLQNELLDHAKHNHWGLYRNTRLEMGKILKAEGRNLPALDTYLEVCYLDLNGPTNYGVAGPERIEFDEDDSLLIAPFNPDEGQLFDGVVRMVFDVVTEEQLSLKDLEARFLKVASTTQRQRKLSVIPDDAWRALNADFDWD